MDAVRIFLAACLLAASTATFADVSFPPSGIVPEGSKRLDEGKTDTAVTVYNTLVVADRGQIPPIPTISQRLLPEE